MALTTDLTTSKSKSNSSITDDIIYKVGDPTKGGRFQGTTSSGGGTIYTSSSFSAPAAIANMVADEGGAKSASFDIQFDPGTTYIGFDPSSGTWALELNQS
jgi:hypothetical protein